MINKVFMGIKKILRYSTEKCGRCGSMRTMVTDQNYRCFDCGYDDPYRW